MPPDFALPSANPLLPSFPFMRQVDMASPLVWRHVQVVCSEVSVQASPGAVVALGGELRPRLSAQDIRLLGPNATSCHFLLLLFSFIILLLVLAPPTPIHISPFSSPAADDFSAFSSTS